MKLTTKEKTTIDYYDKNAQEWVEKHGGFEGGNKNLEKLFKLVPQGRALEVGVGSGKDAEKLIKHYGTENYIGFEPAKGLMLIAKKNVPQGNFVNKSIQELDYPAGYFDTFWISAMLIHLPKKQLVPVLKLIRKVTKSNSYGFFSIMEGEGDLEGNRPGRYYSLWSQDEFERELKKGGFSVKEKMRTVYEKGSPWLDYIVKTL